MIDDRRLGINDFRWRLTMNLEPAMNRYCRGLSRSANDAIQDGLDPSEVLQGLIGTIALSVRRAGGDDVELAHTFRTLAACYEEEGGTTP